MLAIVRSARPLRFGRLRPSSSSSSCLHTTSSSSSSGSGDSVDEGAPLSPGEQRQLARWTPFADRNGKLHPHKPGRLFYSTSLKDWMNAAEPGHSLHEDEAVHKVPEHFKPCLESEITNEMVMGLHNDIRHAIHSDCVVIGAGLSGLTCVYNLLNLAEEKKLSPSLKITLLNKDQNLGGSGWSGANNLNTLIVRKPGHEFLNSLGVHFEDRNERYVVCRSGAEIIAKLLAKITASKNVTVLPAECKEVLFQDPHNSFSSVRGVGSSFPDFAGNSSLFFNAKTVVVATGNTPVPTPLQHNLRRYASFGLQMESLGTVYGTSTDTVQAEDYMVHNTRAVSGGLIFTGSAINELDFTAVAGPTAAGRICSGLAAADLALVSIEKARDTKATRSIGYEAAGHFLHDETLGDSEEMKKT